MDSSIKKGVGFGLTSGIITTLGMLIVLSAVSESKTVVLGGILSIAIADAASDAMGMHISEESHERAESKHIWQATISTFISKFIFAVTFLIPILTLNLDKTVIVSLIWGFFLIGIFSYKIAKDRNENPFTAVAEHTTIAVIVLAVIHFTGNLIKSFAG
ncbi:hypothetical protein [Persephonella sp.]|uniref:hypothetical protein n=1 Tax=Persephonella sp. TaxID=2060922 RepID=UPI0025F0D37C|nr:hypothetical protein [Persephonella sp.]